MQTTKVTSPPGIGDRLAFRRILVPMDGSPLAESALTPARALAHVFGAELELLAVGSDPAEAVELGHSLEMLGAQAGVSATSRVDKDVAAAILRAAAEEDGTLLCLASHGRGGLPRAILGSVARSVVAGAGAPVVLAGPHYDPIRKLDEGPVLACVDGSPPSEEIIPVAASWAAALEVPLAIVTVAEPVPRPLDQRPYHRLHGPGMDAQVYVGRLAARWRDRGVDLLPVALYDPLSAADGLSMYLRANSAGLLTVNTRPRSGAANLFGSRAAAIVRMSPVPVLVAARHDAP